MNETLPRRRFWPIAGCLVTVVATLGCLLLAGYFYLPALVTRRLPVAQIQRLGFSDFRGRISRIGLHRATAGPVTFGPSDQPAIAIGAITLDYTPWGLRQKTIRRARIRDVVVNASLSSDGLSFPGLDLSAFAKNKIATAAPAVESSALAAITLGKMEICSGLLKLSWQNATYKIPFEAVLTADGRDMTVLDARIRLFPRGQSLVVTARIDVKHRKGRVHVDATMIDMDRFADLVHLIPGLDATGTISVQANAMVALAPVAITNAHVKLAWHRGELTYASVLIEPESGGASVILTGESEDFKTWQIQSGGVQLQTPVPVALSMLAATVNLDNGLRTVAGNAELTIPPFILKRPTPISLTVGASLPVTFDATRKDSGEWTTGFKTTGNRHRPPLDPLVVSIAGVDMLTSPPHFNFTAKGDNQAGAADWQLDLNPIRATAAVTTVNLPSSDAKGQLQFRAGPHGTAWTGDARIQIHGPTIDSRGMTGKLDRLTMSARMQQQGTDPPVVDARMQFSNGRFHHPASGLLVSGLQLDLPYHTDTGKTRRNGAFSVARVDHQHHLSGNVHGYLTQKKDAYAFTAIYESDLLPGMTGHFTGTVHTHGPHLPFADLTVKIPSYELPVETDLGRFIPAAKGIDVSGTVSARGKVSLSRKGVQGSLVVAIAGGALQLAEKTIMVEGIDTALHFSELPRIRSDPAQQIRFSRAALGGIIVEGGAFDVQVESEKTLFVEKGRLLWCGGKVDAGSLRITTGKDEYLVNLYCQRLELSRILEQLGSVNARGTGTVNGRIPIVYRNGNIRFDDGFLFSTPGEGGQVHLTGTDVLTRGIPAGTPQFAQVDLAREALKDYAYNWAKLGLVSEGEDFVMRLQLDGKPVNRLPFVYQKEIGSFVRVEASAQGSVFQGIGLDVNLRLPLNQLLQYKDIVNMLE